MEPTPSLEKLRVRGGYALLAVIVALAVTSQTGATPNLDSAVFLTLMGGYLATVGAGAVVRLFNGKGDK